jgi:hypothetical protein
MKLNDLKKLIREAVREEMRSVLREELKDVKFLVDVLSEAKNLLNQAYKNLRNIRHLNPNQNEILVLKNGVLNDILSETANSFSNDEYKTMFNGNSSMAPNFAAPQSYDFKSAAPQTDHSGKPAEITPELDQVFSRDYGALMDRLI